MAEAKSLIGNYKTILINLSFIRITEKSDKFTIFDRFSPRIKVTHDLISDRSQYVGWQPITTLGNKTMPWLYMNIITTPKRFFPMSTNKSSEVVLVGRFIRRETSITVK